MKLFICVLSLLLEVIGFKYIYSDYIVLYTVFLFINTVIVLRSLSKGLRDNLIYVYTFTGWMLYNALGFLHYELVNTQHQRLTEIYILFILSTILMYIPIHIFSKKTSCQKPKNLNINPSLRLIILLLTISVALSYYKIILAGGWYNYINASYGLKVESGLMTFFHLFEGIFSTIIPFTYPILFRNNPLKWKIYISICLLLLLFIQVASGASASVVSFFMPLFIFAYFQTSNRRIKAIYKKSLIVFVSVAVVFGMMIRVNRKDNGSFKVPEISEMTEEIMESRTFDNIVNLEEILTRLQPTYTMDQFIYPFVNMLPRAVFPWKPVELGSIVGVKFIGTSEEARVGFLTSPLGDFYYDMGYVGIVAGMLYIGFFIVFARNLINRYMASRNLYALVLMIAISVQLGGLNAWYTGCFMRIVRIIIFVFLLIFLQRFFGRNKQTYHIDEK